MNVHNRLCFPYLIITKLWIILTGTMVLVLCVDVKPQKEIYLPDYNTYHNLSAIGLTVDRFVKTYPNIIRYGSAYSSKQGRSQILLEITNFEKRQQNPQDKDLVKILLSFGEHAREFLPVETLLYLLRQISEQQHNNRTADNVPHNNFIDLSHIHIYAIVMGNPDGRSYVESTRNYCWRGTSTGADINRNFDWEYGGKGSSADTKDEEYRGHHVFSEPETRVYTELTKKIQFDAFISLHSGIRQIYIPYADSRSQELKREPANLEEMVRLAAALASSTRAGYQYGRAARLNDYAADGTVFDYMAGKRKIPFSYAIELWGPDNYKGSSCFDLFNPPNHRLQAVIEDIFSLYATLFDHLVQWKRGASLEGSQTGPSNYSIHHSPYHPDLAVSDKRAVDSKTTVPSLAPGYALLCIVVVLTALVGLHGRYPVCRRVIQRRRVVSLRSLSTTFSTSMFGT